MAASTHDAQAEAEALFQAQAEGRLFVTEYPYALASRDFPATTGGRRIVDMMSAAAPRAFDWLAAIARHGADLGKIAADPVGEEPGWSNGMLPALDGMMLYVMTRTLRPATYLEVGSGNSTKFVRRAIRDGNLSTRIVSIDPHPRAEIDSLCDEVIRTPVENVPEADYVQRLTSGDVVFIDNSHRSFPNSDVTTFFTEMLPALPGGVNYGIHDICLPFDYPPEWMARFYNEQYLLAAYLLGGAGGDAIEFPATFVATDSRFQSALAGAFAAPGLTDLPPHGGAFWMRRHEPAASGAVRRLLRAIRS